MMKVVVCRSLINETGDGDKVLFGDISTECGSAWLVFIINLIFSISFFVGILCLKRIITREIDSQTFNKPWIHVLGHILRSIGCLFLCFWTLCEIGEAVLSDLVVGEFSLYLYLPLFVQFIGSVLLMVYVHHVEQSIRPKFMHMVWLYYLCAAAAKGFYVYSLFLLGLGVPDLRFDFTWDIIVNYLLLLILEVVVWFAWSCYTKEILIPRELPVVTEIQTYVSFLSKATFWWIGDMLSTGYKRPLQDSDLGHIAPVEWSGTNFVNFNKLLIKRKEEGRKLSIHSLLCRVHLVSLIVGGICKISGDLFVFVGPLCIDGIINYIHTWQNGTVQEDRYISLSYFTSNGFVLCFALLFSLLMANTLTQAHENIVSRMGNRCASSLKVALFEKALHLSPAAMTEDDLSAGKIINHFSQDTDNVNTLFLYIHDFIAVPIQVGVCLLMMYLQIGYSGLIGGSVVVLLAPFQYLLGKGQSALQKKAMSHSDQRLKLTNELISGIQLLKLQAWELKFSEAIGLARKKELEAILKEATLKSVALFTVEAFPIIGTLVCFASYSALEPDPLTPAQAFTVLSLMNILMVPLFITPIMINALVSASVSYKRLEKFLLAGELEKPHVNVVTSSTLEEISDEMLSEYEERREFRRLSAPRNSSSLHRHNREIDETQGDASVKLLSYERDEEPDQSRSANRDEVERFEQTPYDGLYVNLERASFSWGRGETAAVLSDISLQVPQHGSLVVITGPVGCGKSSLLSAILGELHTTQGTSQTYRGHGVAYCSQRPWIMNATFKENVLFGASFDEGRYQQVLRACALETDLDMFGAGDETEIGEKGVNLSGGQKARVALARAIYTRAKLVLLDDPLAALDSHVGHHVFEEVIQNLLIKEKRTVILVTHQLQYAFCADLLVVLEEGRIKAQGSVDYIKENHNDILDRWNEFLHIDDSEDKPDESNEKDDDAQVEDEDEEDSELDGARNDASADQQSDGAKGKGKGSKSARMIEQEERVTGGISLKNYMTYFKAVSIPLVLLLLFLFLAKTGLQTASDVWLSRWSSDLGDPKSASPNSTAPAHKHSLSYYMEIYVALTMSTVLVSLMASMLVQVAGWISSKRLHESMIWSLAKAPMRFFDTNLMGRILNRCSTDVATIDRKLTFTSTTCLGLFLEILAAMTVNAIATPYFLISLVPILIVYGLLQRYFRTSSREFQRLKRIRNSPLLAHLSETVAGLSTVRAFGREKQFTRRLMTLIDRFSSAFLLLKTANLWLSIRLDYLGTMLAFCASVSALSAAITGGIEAGLVGLAISYVLRVGSKLNWLVLNVASAEMQMSSVERVNYYASLDSEKYGGRHQQKLRKNSEALQSDRMLARGKEMIVRGEIELRAVSLRYAAELPNVIKQVSVHIPAGSKIGVCGRTGSGKSSLTLGLFRLIDVSEGEIIIDGHNTAEMPLLALRSSVAVIPQDPVLFSGSVRSNLDPFSLSSDSDLWRALEVAQLKQAIQQLENGLASQVSEGGSNFSVGQRQLFCLARALLRNTRILVLDEATASVDMATDKQIQNVLASEFTSTTVISIAHRVSSLLNYDKIIVMDQGKLAEMGNPTELMEKSDGLFAALVKKKR